jgi:hypothetical protein
MRKRSVTAAVCVLSVVALSAGPAFGGEVTGTGMPLWTNTDDPNVEHTLHGLSACAFSGLNDEYYYWGDTSTRRTQNWGESASTGAHAGVPGTACNPTSGVEE